MELITPCTIGCFQTLNIDEITTRILPLTIIDSRIYSDQDLSKKRLCLTKNMCSKYKHFGIISNNFRGM